MKRRRTHSQYVLCVMKRPVYKIRYWLRSIPFFTFIKSFFNVACSDPNEVNCIDDRLSKSDEKHLNFIWICSPYYTLQVEIVSIQKHFMCLLLFGFCSTIFILTNEMRSLSFCKSVWYLNGCCNIDVRDTGKCHAYNQHLYIKFSLSTRYNVILL